MNFFLNNYLQENILPATLKNMKNGLMIHFIIQNGIMHYLNENRNTGPPCKRRYGGKYFLPSATTGFIMKQFLNLLD